MQGRGKRLRAQLAEAERGQVAAAERQFGERQATDALQGEMARAQARLASSQRDVAAQRAAAEALEAGRGRTSRPSGTMPPGCAQKKQQE